ncbi:MAG: hypothetical protein ABW352_17180 [Polyangiales bacterium]
MRRAIWLAALVVACGDDGGDATANKKLSELDSEELSEVCAKVDARFSRFEIAFVSASCTQTALMTPSTCETTRTQCIAGTNPVGSLAGKVELDCEGTPLSLNAACAEISVEELDTCSDQIIDGIEALSAKITCTADLAMLKPPETPASCTKLGTRCPTLSAFKL